MEPAVGSEGFAVGHVIAGKYEISGVLGRGGMGIVYEARHRRLGSRVAIKVLHGVARERPDIAARFQREARAAARLNGPHVARVTDVEALEDGTPYIVMEYLTGRDLDAELSARGRIPPEEAVDYVLDACSALAEAHDAEIVHRDVKPHNLFLADAGGKRMLKLLDFGVSKVALEGEDTVTNSQSLVGTPAYMSPEQIRSPGRVDARSDVWSLGVVLYELLSGRRPFLGEGAPAVMIAITVEEPVPLALAEPSVTEPLSLVVMRALEKEPERRHQSIRELASELEPFGSGGASRIPTSSASTARKAPPIEDAVTVLAETSASVPATALSTKGESRSRSIALVVAAVAALIGGALVLGWQLGLGSDPVEESAEASERAPATEPSTTTPESVVPTPSREAPPPTESAAPASSAAPPPASTSAPAAPPPRRSAPEPAGPEHPLHL